MSPEVKMAMFRTLDHAPCEALREPGAVRECLYEVALHCREPITELVESYIELLIAEFCPDHDPSRLR